MNKNRWEYHKKNLSKTWFTHELESTYHFMAYQMKENEKEISRLIKKNRENKKLMKYVEELKRRKK